MVRVTFFPGSFISSSIVSVGYGGLRVSGWLLLQKKGKGGATAQKMEVGGGTLEKLKAQEGLSGCTVLSRARQLAVLDELYKSICGSRKVLVL